jgi:hypothetical protein
VSRAQKLPQDFIDRLRALYPNPRGLAGSREPQPELNAYLAAANASGWTLRILADVLGVSHQMVKIRIGYARQAADAMPLPELPEDWRRTPSVPPDAAERLRGASEVARTVNGRTPVDAPARRVSEEFTAELHALLAAGTSCADLARVTGLTKDAIWTRLARHGYTDRRSPPSVYRNIQIEPYGGRRSSRRDGYCKHDHEMTGRNVMKSGQCRECNRAAVDAYNSRKKAAKGGSPPKD